MESARSEQLKQRRRQEYNAKNKEVKQSAREDNRNWMEERAAAAEKAAENGRNKELYNITKTVAGVPCEQLVSPTPNERETTASNRLLFHRACASSSRPTSCI